MSTIAELMSSLVDARADVTSIQSVLADAQRVADTRAAALAKVAAELNAALDAQSKAERAYAEKETEANANAMQTADRDVRAKTVRRDATAGDNEKAQDTARGAREALEKATARVSSLERRIEIEKLRIAASPEAVHDAIDELALKAAAIVDELLDVTAEIGTKLDAATSAAEQYSKATGEQLRPIDRRHAFLAVLEALSGQGIDGHILNEILEALLPSSNVTSAARLVNGIEQLLRAPEAKPERAAAQRRLFTLFRERRTYNEASHEHQRFERDLDESQRAALAAQQPPKPVAWRSGASRYFDPGADAIARQRALSDRK